MPRRTTISDPDDILIAFRNAKDAYRGQLDAANKNNRFIRRRKNLGGSGDAQLTAYQLWYVRETARNMVQNDSLPGQVTETLVDELLREPFRLEPQTGDPKLDAAIQQAFREWASEPLDCDYEQDKDFWEITWMQMFRTVIDGDCFGILTEDGTIQSIEADRCLSPSDVNASTNITNGVELNNEGIAVAYWFAKNHPSSYVALADQLQRYPIRDENGIRVVTQLFAPHRFSQHRGYSWWHRVMVDAGMLDDLDFAMVLKAQTAASIAGVVERDVTAPTTEVKFGQDLETTTTDEEGEDLEITKIKPNALIQLPPGAKLGGFTPNVPNQEHLQHVKHQLKKIGAALHVPYVMLLLDASETNFSGYRGAVATARDTWRRIQKSLIRRWLSPVYRWWAVRWLAKQSQTVRRRAAEIVRKHKWIPPAWRYIEPLRDAQADTLILESRLNSPRGLLGERGLDYDQIVQETIEDNAKLIEAACARAEQINKAFPNANVSWREVARWSMPRGLNLSGMLEETNAKNEER